MSDPIHDLAKAQELEDERERRDEQRRRMIRQATRDPQIRRPWTDTARFVLKRLVVIEVVVLAVIAAIYYGVLGRRDADEYAMGVLVAGVVIFAIGPFSMLGSWGTTRTWTYQYIRTMEDNSSLHRTRQDRGEVQRSSSLIVPSMLIGTITIILAILIQTLTP